jgi:hydrogenase-4 component H
MFHIFRRSARIGIVTTSYPAQAELAPEGFRGTPDFTPAHCDANGACAAVCPSGAIAMQPAGGGAILTIDRARCIGCGRCVEVCAPGALTISREFALASRSRRDLLVVAHLPERSAS